MNATPEQQAALLAAGISPALVELVEFVEEDGSRVAVCDPGCAQSGYFADLNRWRWIHRVLPLNDSPAHCPTCGTILDFLFDNTPFRIRHSRVLEALEQAQADVSRLRGALIRTQEERDRLREALINIGDNFGGDPVWLARAALKRWHFAEYDSAPEWFREAALATEEAPDE
ncbi:MAG: hypothetical protein GX936_10775 [Clostridiales bacterium]|nr:hypothetical protein [Clostridiales bacterium]